MTPKGAIGAIAACVLLAALVGFVDGATATTPGSLDTSFATGGKATIDFGSEEDGFGLALRPDGKIVVVGSTRQGQRRDAVAAQLTAAGVRDKSFGADGKTVAGFGADDAAFAVALQPDGKIVLAGAVGTGALLRYEFAVSRVNTKGLFDPSFATGGRATVDFGGSNSAHAIALRPNGKIILAGTTTKGTKGWDFAVAQFNPDGTIDGSFGAAGKTTADLGGDEEAYGVAVQPDGKVVVVGTTSKGLNGSDIAVARINPNGLYDTSFGTGGRTTVDFRSREDGAAIVLRPDGKIVVAGTTRTPGQGGDFVVAQLNPDGTLDSSFGVGGRTVADFGADGSAYALALRADGKILVAGAEVPKGNGADFAVAQLDAKGSFDKTFGTGGRAVVDFGGGDFARAAAVQPDGRIVLAGRASAAVTDLAVARLVGTPNAAAKALTARIVSAKVLGQGSARTLTVKIRVSKAATATVRLRKQGVEQLKKTYAVKAGANTLKTVLPALQKGTYALEITLRAPGGQRKVVKAKVSLPA